MAFNDIVDEVDRNRLERLQVVRETIINDLTKEGIPSSKDDRAFLLETMKDMDKSVIGKARIKVSDKTADNLKNASALIAEVLSRHTAPEAGSRLSAPELDPDYKLDDLNIGETDADNVLDYKGFMPD